jgi:hypothetical protein
MVVMVGGFTRGFWQVASGKLKAGRDRRQHMKLLLEPIIGINIGQAFSSRVKVLDLPEKLVIAKQPSLDGASEEGEFELHRLFEEA